MLVEEKVPHVTSDKSSSPTSNPTSDAKDRNGSDHSNLKSEPNVAQDQEEASNEAKPQPSDKFEKFQQD